MHVLIVYWKNDVVWVCLQISTTGQLTRLKAVTIGCNGVGIHMVVVWLDGPCSVFSSMFCAPLTERLQTTITLHLSLYYLLDSPGHSLVTLIFVNIVLCSFFTVIVHDALLLYLLNSFTFCQIALCFNLLHFAIHIMHSCIYISKVFFIRVSRISIVS